ncbi:MAG: carbohydrate kinase family protein [bacterium]
MKRLYDIITVGTATRDIFLRSANFHLVHSRHLVPGETEFLALGNKIDITSLIVSTGGGATNAAATFAKFGYRTAYVGRVGVDEDGNAILRDLRERNIETRYVRRDRERRTAMSVLLSPLHHRRTILVYRGASQDLRSSDLPLAHVRSRWLYVTSLGGDFSVSAAIVRATRRHKISLMINPGAGELQYPSRLLALLRHATIVLMNREEAGMLVGGRAIDDTRVRQTLAKKIPGILCITDEEHGAWVHFCGRTFRSSTHRRLRVVERTGAGDAFGSGFLCGYLATRGDISEALQYATANAESVMKKVGAKNGILGRKPRGRERIHVVCSPFSAR